MPVAGHVLGPSVSGPIRPAAFGWVGRIASVLTGLALARVGLIAQIPGFPGAEGFGSAAAGGRGGDVYVVTNLNASGAGSFSEAVLTAPVGGRTIVFAVSGHIRLPSGSGGTTVAKSKLTIAGQTAPGDGICFWNNTMTFTGDDVIVRHVRFRYGKQAAGGDAIDISGSQRIIFDHCDVMFSTDENLSSFGTPPEFFTFQWSINAWGLQSHSAGGLWDVDHATSHHSLWANNHTRNPKLIAPSVFDWANNVTFGWDNGFNMAESPTGGTGYTHRVNVRGSSFIHGASTTEAIYGGGANADGTNKFKLHMSDSALDGNNNGVADVSRTNYQMVSSTSYDQTAVAWPQTVDGVSGGTVVGVPVTLDSRLAAYRKVLSQVGAARMEYDAVRPLRDEITQLCATRVATQRRGIISDPLELGLSTGTAFAALNSTTPPTDTDKDGMPDVWESTLGTDPAVQSHNMMFPGTNGFISGVTFFPANTPVGYTHLEEYLHFKAQPHALLPKNTVASPSYLDVDLSRYTGGFVNNPMFTLANASGGTTAQSGAGGKIVRFTPTPDVSGRAWFDFTVTDADGIAWTQRFCLLVSSAAIPRDLGWVGDGVANPWNTTAALWTLGGAATTFNDGDFVTLDDTGSATPALALAGTLRPASVLVDASAKNYTLTGGSFAGSMTLTKRGGGTLTLRSNHAHTGGTRVEDGALVLGLVGTTPNSTGSVGSGTLVLLGDSTLSNAWYGTQLPLAAPISVPSGAEPVVYTGRNIRFSGALSGTGSLEIVNQTVTGSNTFELTGPWGAFAGSLRISRTGTNGGIRTVFNGGSFNGFGAAFLELGGGNSINPVTNSGGNTFGIGALIGTDGDAILNGGTAGSPTYTIGALDASTAFAGKIQGNAKLTKVGTGTLTLTGASTHTGATAVSAGGLVVDGSFGTSAVTVAGGALLGGSGTLGGIVTVASGGIVDPVGTFTTGAFAATASTLRFHLTNSPAGANDRINAGSATVTLSGAHTIEITEADGYLGAGIYPLISTTGTLTAAGATFSHNLVNTPRQTFAVVATATALNLVVTGSAVDLTWSGAQTQWDIGATSAWINGTANDVFYDGDAVAFTDSATNGAVTIGAPVTPRSVIVNNTTRAFSMSGSEIAGGGVLRKSGAGTLTLNASNTFGGGTVLNDGVIQLGSATANAAALGGGTVAMNGGVLRMYSAGTGTHAGTLPNALHVSGNARFEVAPRCGFSGGVSGYGTLDYRTNYVRADITGDWSHFTGQVNVTTTGSGDFRIASSYAWPGLPNATVNLAAGTYFYMSGIVDDGKGTTIAIGAIAGASGSHLRGGVTAARTLTYRIGGKGSDATYTGDIAEQNSGTTTAIVKTGAGVWALGGPATHRGGTTVDAGTLCLLAGGSIANAAPISVRSGALFCMNGGSADVESINIEEGATFSSNGGGITGEFNNSGIATVNSGTLTLSGDVTNSGTLRVTGGAQLVINGTFVNTGVLDLLTSGSPLPANLVNTGIVITNTDRRILSSARSGTNFSVTVAGHAGHSYQLQRTGALGGTWTNIGSAVSGGGETLVLTDSGALGSRLFYRVAIIP